MTTQNLVIGWPNRIDAGALSGGTWASDLPLSHLQTDDLSQVARSFNSLESSTQFRLAMDKVRVLRAFGFVNHNCSTNAQWKVTLGTTAGAADLHDSGWIQVWRMGFDDLIEWESATWWVGIGADEFLRAPFPAIHVLPDYINAQHVSIYLRDTANVDGYVQLGRVFVGNAIQPAYNMSYGLQDGIVDMSSVDRSESGVLWPSVRRKLRTVSLALDWLSDEEGAYLHEMMRQLGTTGEVLYIPYPDDMARSQQYGFLGRLSELSPLEYPYHRVRRLPLRIEEMA